MAGRLVAAHPIRRSFVAVLAAALLVGFAALGRAGLPGGARAADAISNCAAIDYCATLSFDVVGDGSGNITAGPNNELVCTQTDGTGASSCSYEFAWPVSSGTTLQVPVLMGAPQGSYLCPDDTSGNPCSGSLDSTNGDVPLTAGQTTVQAVGFWKIHYTLTIVAAGPGSGAVAVGSPTSKCELPCTEQDLFFATTVVVYAEPRPGSTIGGWSAPCAGSRTSCGVYIEDNTTLTITFDRATATLAARGSPRPSASIVGGPSVSPSGGAPSLAPGSSADLASPGPGAEVTPVSGASDVPLLAVLLLVAAAAVIGIGAGIFFARRRRS